MSDNAENINANAQQPKRVAADGVSAEQHSIPDQIAADQYAKANDAAASGPGIKYRKLRHRGPVW